MCRRKSLSLCLESQSPKGDGNSGPFYRQCIVIFEFRTTIPVRGGKMSITSPVSAAKRKNEYGMGKAAAGVCLDVLQRRFVCLEEFS